MRKSTVVLLISLLVLAIFVAGCTGTERAGEATKKMPVIQKSPAPVSDEPIIVPADKKALGSPVSDEPIIVPADKKASGSPVSDEPIINPADKKASGSPVADLPESGKKAVTP